LGFYCSSVALLGYQPGPGCLAGLTDAEESSCIISSAGLTEFKELYEIFHGITYSLEGQAAIDMLPSRVTDSLKSGILILFHYRV